ncbi:hypothetical protein [Bartonella tamiae]|uniref:hypothetical protein n=1 Tax=Bartonella tamiae TaxID=373638 RepID=UPI00030F6E7C|nr:hypothetical protein [Bartonella tamiae]
MVERKRLKDAAAMRFLKSQSFLGMELDLPVPVEEENRYRIKPRVKILLFPQTEKGLIEQ